MANENCLRNIACPKCGHERKFSIVASAVFVVTDDGTDEFQNVEWNDDSEIQCGDCGLFGKVRDFRVSEQIEGPCPHCGRVEDGHWYSPCPSDDCPSHASESDERVNNGGRGEGHGRFDCGCSVADGQIEFCRLHKAAPRVLEALRGCLYALDPNMDGYGPSRQTAMDEARAIISHAQGGESPTEAALAGEPTIADRVKLVEEVFLGYYGAAGNQDPEANVADILADLRHYSDTHGLNLGVLDRRAHRHYLAELKEEGRL